METFDVSLYFRLRGVQNELTEELEELVFRSTSNSEERNTHFHNKAKSLVSLHLIKWSGRRFRSNKKEDAYWYNRNALNSPCELGKNIYKILKNNGEIGVTFRSTSHSEEGKISGGSLLMEP